MENFKKIKLFFNMCREVKSKKHCKGCGVDITKLVFSKGERVIFYHVKNNLGIIAEYCRKCIKEYDESV